MNLFQAHRRPARKNPDSILRWRSGSQTGGFLSLRAGWWAPLKNLQACPEPVEGRIPFAYAKNNGRSGRRSMMAAVINKREKNFLHSVGGLSVKNFRSPGENLGKALRLERSSKRLAKSALFLPFLRCFFGKLLTMNVRIK